MVTPVTARENVNATGARWSVASGRSSLNYHDNRRSERRPSPLMGPLMGEGLGGGAGAQQKRRKEHPIPSKRFFALRGGFILVPPSRMNRTYEIRVSRAAIEPASPPPNLPHQGGGFRMFGTLQV
jgi:hypothetical protein